MLTTIFTDIATGLGVFVPAFFGAMLDAFVALFIDATAETVTLTPVGQIALVFIVMSATYKIMPTVIGWLRLRASKRKKRTRKA